MTTLQTYLSQKRQIAERANETHFNANMESPEFNRAQMMRCIEDMHEFQKTFSTSEVMKLLKIIDIQAEALEDYECTLQVVEAQIKLRPEWFQHSWRDQIEFLLKEARSALAKVEEVLK